jgi:predicted GNAT family acetyltransferase
MTVEHVESDVNGGRFVVRIGDTEAELVYTRPGPTLIDLQHTYVPKGARGQGVAEALAKAAFAYARAQGFRVIPSCPFVRRWLQMHPEEAALVDERYAGLVERRPRR